jgi:hypothetical protein
MLNTITMGTGRAEFDAVSGTGLLTTPASGEARYTNAQVDDYQGVRRRWFERSRFQNEPPLHMSLRARASDRTPVGTLGFGFWNEPFSVSGSVLGTPNALWYFYASPPSDMALVSGVPGWGWKAASLNTGRLPGLLLAPAAVGAIALTRVPGLGRPVMKLARRFVAAHEAILDDVMLDDWHHYELDWGPGEARFVVDGRERLRSQAPPTGRLGFVMWIDNQYAIASEQGKFGFGVLDLPRDQCLEIQDFRLERGLPVV